MAMTTLAIHMATIRIDTDETNATATILLGTIDLHLILATDAPIRMKLLYTHVQPMLQPHSKMTAGGPLQAPTCNYFCPCLRRRTHYCCHPKNRPKLPQQLCRPRCVTPKNPSATPVTACSGGALPLVYFFDIS
uniref:Uncharacterized protein n=1 Tax=Romanomermis culicivorax TaxID=13658 RepID=A0A915L5J8_ROMCU